MNRYLVAIFFVGCLNTALAEPYLAIREGMQCSSCHVDPTGGGMRNEFGNIYGQNNLPAEVLNITGDTTWTGQLAGPISIGGNGRYSARQFDVDNVDNATNFSVDRASIYIGARLNENISFMVDQQLAPGGSISRATWVKINNGDWYLKAGKLFQPFGWRLEDDTAVVRQVTGINFTNGDNGVELGYERGSWSAQLALTNGTGSDSEVDDGKQASARLANVASNFQWGINANFNNTDNGERTIAGVFAGLNTGPITWLFEWDQISDKDFASGDLDQDIALLEANYLLTKGHNLKVSLEGQRFDDDTEDRMRYSVVYEYFPISFSQFRLGVREREGEDLNPILDAQLNVREIFAQLHVYF
jgi:hypothetical protein